MTLDYHKYVADVAANDVTEVLPRDEKYQGSWQKRGGSGVFANLARKWDRIEAACGQCHYDLMIAFLADDGPAGLIDDIRDLRRYLLLTEAWLIQHGGLPTPPNYPVADRARLHGDRQNRRTDSPGQPGESLSPPRGGVDATKPVLHNALYENDPHDAERRVAKRRRRAAPQAMMPHHQERRRQPSGYYNYGRRGGDDPSLAVSLKEKRREPR